MSLTRIATRMAAVAALRGRTLAGGNVRDSAISVLDAAADGTLRTDSERPWIAVYTDSSALTMQGGKAAYPDASLRAFVPNGLTTITFEIGVASDMIERDPETGVSSIVTGIPATDAGLELFLDIVARQIGDALTDPDSAWAEVFRRFIASIHNVERMRADSDTNGVRLAAQQIRVTADLRPDPVRGDELADTHPIERFFAHAESTLRVPNPASQAPNPAYPDSSDISTILDPSQPGTIVDPVIASTLALMRAQMTGNGAAAEADLIRRRHGHTESEARALGYALKSPHPIAGYTIEDGHAPAAG